MSQSKRIVIPRQALLVEIERRCASQDCRERARISLTKAEARAYCGFECARCGRWTKDLLTERDIPEWWEELILMSSDRAQGASDSEAYEPSAAARRMSEAYRRTLSVEGQSEERTGAGEN